MADSATTGAAGGVRRETPMPKGRLAGFAAGATVGLATGVEAGDAPPRSKQPAAPVLESAVPAPQLLPQLPKLPRPGTAAARSKQPAAVVTEATPSPPAAVPPAEPPPAPPPAPAAPPTPPPTAARPPPAAPPELAAASTAAEGAAVSCALLWRLVRSFDCRSNALRRPSASRLTGLAAGAGGPVVNDGLATNVVTGAAAAAATGVALGRAVACALLLCPALSAARLRLTSNDSVRRCGIAEPFARAKTARFGWTTNEAFVAHANPCFICPADGAADRAGAKQPTNCLFGARSKVHAQALASSPDAQHFFQAAQTPAPSQA